MKEKYLMSVKEASDYFGIGRNRFYEIVRSHPDIPIIKVGQSMKVNVPMFEKWLDECVKEGRKI